MALRDLLNAYDLGAPTPLAPVDERRRRVPPEVWGCLERIKASVGALLGRRLREVRLFGSYARGDFDESSDVDVLIVVDGLAPEERDRVLEMVVEQAGSGAYPMPILLSLEQFQALRARKRILAMDLDREGIPV